MTHGYATRGPIACRIVPLDASTCRMDLRMRVDRSPHEHLTKIGAERFGRHDDQIAPVSATSAWIISAPGKKNPSIRSHATLSTP